MAPYCPQHEHLLAAYESATRVYQAAVMKLENQHGAEFRKSNAEIEHLHVEVERAQERLQRHTREHGCGWHESISA